MSGKNNALAVTLGQHSRAGQGGINQDFHGAMLPAEPLRSTKGIAVALADGIGSSAVSQEASAAAVRSFLDDYYATSDAWSVRRSAQRVLGATNAWLHAQTMRSHARFDKDRGYVCTFSALILKGRDIHLLHVGDSRIYRVHAQSLEPLTQDHRVHLSSVESFLGRALGTGPNVEIDYTTLPADVGAIYLLATDGAYLHIDAAAVHQALALHPDDWDRAAQALVDTAQARGADDDMTVQLLRVDALPEVPLRDLQALRADLAIAPLLAPNARFEGYRIVRELHASARSHVYLAVDDATAQQMVLKTPSIEMAGDALHLDRFLLEEWVARRIHSPHVLRPHVHERPRTHMYVAMEFVEGHTLAQWMIDHPSPDLDTVRGLIAQVGKGLHAFHVKEMLHQDLRPDNVMIDRQGTIRIIDFGSTRVAGLEEGSQDPRADAIAGTLQYTAPEYFVGQEGSAQSDLFSLAVLAYQMLTAQLPYGLHAARVRSVADIKGLRYVPVRHFRPDLPQWLDSVLQKALNPDPARRQEAVSEFLFDLHAPGRAFRQRQSVPLVQRNPVVFWQTISWVLGLSVVALLGARALGW
ncbi:bifunctional protein-serine/threonine kinase/phosphatase [Acidovorax sp. Leaf78]|uniref:bifunctional protein-serine/threonine kinase/phosphatase n=1 Tax=Acidovorax sp. Leaf78 TaxID=1736237 RepID=UPI0006F61A4E|nr:bifunctional protein-serine/threonine kinase/phosphatase [Acidovorax sp. Leaf78]KQO15875.1 protein kinase [Acidovorax sp. Leaf78]